MNRYRPVDLLAAAATVAVAAGAMIGSADELLTIAHKANLSAEWSLPVSLDCVAVVAALAIQRRRRDPLGWAALFGSTGVSAWLQWNVAPVGAVRPVAALVTFELFLRITGHVRPISVRRRPRIPAPVPAPTPEPVVETAKPTPLEPAVPAKRVADDEIRTVAFDLGLLEPEGRWTSRPKMVAALRAKGFEIGSNRAQRIYESLYDAESEAV